jgi:8-oxo-dGTP pyrophosphatase MutT (NUDIX family)
VSPCQGEGREFESRLPLHFYIETPRMNKKVELVDLVDSSGVIRKHKIPRTEVDLYPDLHMQIVIGVIFDKDGRMLVHKRAQTKKVNPGDIDHVCGGVMSDETPMDAVVRESMEETGVHPVNLKIAVQGVNKYNRFRYLLVGSADGDPGKADPDEVEWIQFIHPEELRQKRDSGEFTFVDEFFEDTLLASEKLSTVK